MDSREVLEDALADFGGTILAVSHDRYFINRFADRVFVLEPDGVREYLGNYDSYFEKISRDAEPDGETAGMTRTALDKEKKRSRAEQQRLKEQKELLRKTEEAIGKAETEAARLEAELADPETYKDPEAAAEKTRLYLAQKEEINRLYGEWEALESGE